MKKERDNFYHLISAKSGLEVEVVKKVYFAMVKVIIDELRNWGVVLLPELGRFTVIIYSNRKIRDVNTRELKQVGATKVLKFSPWYTIKDYIKGFSSQQ